jgi:hypothetical protein
MGEMKAKFAGKCSVCEKRFPKDERILWSREKGARHLPGQCPQGPEPPMAAMYDGHCANCHEPVWVGDPITYVKGEGAYHVDCPQIPTPKPERTVVPLLPDGHFTVMDGRPEDRTYVRISRPKTDGRQLIAIDMSQDERWAMGDLIRWPGRWVGIGYLYGREASLWSGFRDRLTDRQKRAIDALTTQDDWAAMGEMYATEFNVCWVCSSELSAPVSLCRGVGPVCAKRVGIEVDQAAVETWMKEHPVEVTA